MVVACRYIDQWIDYLDKDIRELFHPHNGTLQTAPLLEVVVQEKNAIECVKRLWVSVNILTMRTIRIYAELTRKENAFF